MVVREATNTISFFITEYVNDGEGVPSEDGSSSHLVNEEVKSIKSRLSFKQVTRLFKKHDVS